MILRELREIDHLTDDILVYGWDGGTDRKILTDTTGKLDIVNVNLDIALSDLKTVLDNIDANTDTLEAKTQSIRDQLDVVLSTRSSESTSQAILDALGVGSGTSLLNELQNLTIDTSGLATEATLIQVRDYLDTVETKLQLILDQLDVKLSTRSSEATLSLVKTALDAINLDIDVALSTRASEATLALIKIAIDNINTNIDVNLSTRSSEATSQSILDALGEGSGTTILNELQNLTINTSGLATEATLTLIKTAIDAINTDFDVALSTRSSEATSQAILDTLGEASGTTLLNELQSLDAKDFATEATLALMKTAIDAINTDIDVALSTRASEATLALMKTTIDAIDADLDVALSTRSSEATLLLVKSNLDDLKTKLDTLIATDFATESTLTEVRDTIGQESGSTVLSKLDQLDNTLIDLITPFPGNSVSKFLENVGSSDMNVDGSSTPVEFIAVPNTGKIFYVHSITIVIEDNAMNFNKYGGLATLTNGVDFKIKQNGLAEVTSANIKRNADYYTFVNELIFESSTTDILVGKILIKQNNGTTIKLTDSNSEYIKAVINDDLSGLNIHFVLIRGYEVDE